MLWRISQRLTSLCNGGFLTFNQHFWCAVNFLEQGFYIFFYQPGISLLSVVAMDLDQLLMLLVKYADLLH
ncbi:hypothetical protein [Candidatus Vondammii sp. HM_W22]|uniref:hypothetical protein n=1 Tax=Candidatus Vondammii sp. HM_W22 TaxID=2687299 RepID=UPI001F1348FD|nr:hypothetical protein [Candidatus Vondammii sp. HM_W22]